jgi:flagellar biosynthetic protein FliS
VDNAAEHYKTTTMMSEEPSLDWVEKGWRAIAFYLRTARMAIDKNNLAEKLEAVGKAERLLALLSAITPRDKDSALGSKIGSLYDTFQITLVNANADDDVAALKNIEAALAELEKIMRATFNTKGV